jgi:hypothetical protein
LETAGASTPTPPEAELATSTSTPEASALKYDAPELLEPADGSRIPWKGTLLLTWSSAGTLTGDEYYHLHFERPPRTESEQWYGDYVFTKDTEFLLQGAFLAPFHLSADQGEAAVEWWVRVVRKTGEDAGGKPEGSDVGLHSERRTLILEPKPKDL